MIKITDETVNTFLNGHDPMERIISVECDYMEDMVSIIYVNERGQKMVKKDQFKPFCWAKHNGSVPVQFRQCLMGKCVKTKSSHVEFYYYISFAKIK